MSSLVSGTLSLPHRLTAQVGCTSTVVGNLLPLKYVSGTVVSVSGCSGVLFRHYELGGTVGSISLVAGRLTYDVRLIGTTVCVASMSATLRNLFTPGPYFVTKQSMYTPGIRYAAMTRHIRRAALLLPGVRTWGLKDADQ